MRQGSAVPVPCMNAVPGIVMQEAAVIAPVLMVVSPGPQMMLVAVCCGPPGQKLPFGHSTHAATAPMGLVLK